MLHFPSLNLSGLTDLIHLPNLGGNNTQLILIVVSTMFALADVLLIFADDNNMLTFLPSWALSPLHGFLKPQEWAEHILIAQIGKLTHMIGM